MFIEKFCAFCKTAHHYVYDSCYSVYELLIKVIEKLDEIIDFVNGFQNEIDKKENSENITNNRKLSESGDFTGTLCNGSKTVCEVVQQIDDNKTTIDDVAYKIDNKISIEFIVDGGIFPFTDPANIEIDGGVML